MPDFIDPTSKKILGLLSNGAWHSGTAIGKKLAITRSAVWKNIQELQLRGLEIKTAIGKGYCIPGGIDLLNHAEIIHHIGPHCLSQLHDLIILDHTPSTNDYLMQQAKILQHKNVAVFAEQQTNGRGRRGKSWVSPYAYNIYHSLLWHFDDNPSELTALSLAVALAVADTLQQYGVTSGLQVKWPNDILYYDKKIAGVLLDLVGEAHGTCSVVIGIGINTHLTATEASAISQPWTALSQILGVPISRNRLAGLLLSNLLQTIGLFCAQKWDAFAKRWQELDGFSGKKVVIIRSQQITEGTMLGVNAQGQLLLRDQHNKIMCFSSGEVSLRKALTEKK